MCLLSSHPGYVAEDMLILSRYMKTIQSIDNISVNHEGRIMAVNP